MCSEFFDFVQHGVIGIPEHAAGVGDTPIVVPNDLVGEDRRGRQRSNVLRRDYFPAAAQMILQESLQGGVNAERVPLLPNVRKVPPAARIQSHGEIAVGSLLQVNVEAGFTVMIRCHGLRKNGNDGSPPEYHIVGVASRVPEHCSGRQAIQRDFSDKLHRPEVGLRREKW